MNKPHPHAEIIKAWADGAEIEYKTPSCSWLPYGECPTFLPEHEYRIKPAKREARRWWLYRAVDVYGPDWPAHLKPDALVAFERSSVNAIPVREVMPDEQ